MGATRTRMLLLLLLVVGCWRQCISAPPLYPLPATLPPHPRIILTSNALQQLKQAIATDATAKAAYRQAKATADGVLRSKAPLPPYPNCTAVGLCRGPAGAGGTGTVDSGGSYINTDVAGAVVLALVHRIEANGTHPSHRPSVWSRAAVKALAHWARYPSWYWPVGQALQLSGAAYNFALCFDWLHDVLTEEEKQMVEGAIVAKGLRAARSNFRMAMWWTRDIYNWNLVSNGGMVAAALAVDSEQNETLHALAQEVLEGALGAMQHALVSWQPDGVWPEGTAYWSYALQVNSLGQLGCATMSCTLARTAARTHARAHPITSMNCTHACSSPSSRAPRCAPRWATTSTSRRRRPRSTATRCSAPAGTTWR